VSFSGYGGWTGELLDRRQYRATTPDGGDAELFEVFGQRVYVSQPRADDAFYACFEGLH
jgi:hypothetical protein